MIGSLLAAGGADAQLLCNSDIDCAGLENECIQYQCLSGFCFGQPGPANVPCFAGQCVDAFCDGAGSCVAAGQSALGTPCNDELFCTLNDECDEAGVCVGTEPNPDPQCSQGVASSNPWGVTALSGLLLLVGVGSLTAWSLDRGRGSTPGRFSG